MVGLTKCHTRTRCISRCSTTVETAGGACKAPSGRNCALGNSVTTWIHDVDLSVPRSTGSGDRGGRNRRRSSYRVTEYRISTYGGLCDLDGGVLLDLEFLKAAIALVAARRSPAVVEDEIRRTRSVA